MKLVFDKLAKLSLLLALLMVSVAGYSQRTITGIVSDATGEGVIGANVLVVGTSTGTITDFDGSYSIDVPEGSTQIEFSYIGYTTQTVDITASDVINVVLQEGALLDEVVVIGYGTVKKKDLTGAVTSLDPKDFNKGVVNSADQLIQGKASGVQVTNNSGQPGGAATVRIRGNSSVRAGANPLYVIDGVQLDGRSGRATGASSDLGDVGGSNPLNFLNPDDIASMEILKDASATGIYGSRGANGVILITTKKGQRGEPQLNFGVTLGTSAIANKYNILSAGEYRSRLAEYGITGGDGGGSVDTQDEVFRNAFNQTYNFSMGSGNDYSTYRISASYQDVEGIIKDSGLKRYTGSITTNFKFLEGLVNMDVIAYGSHVTEQLAPVTNGGGAQGSLIGHVLQWNPTVPLRNSDGSFVTSQNSSFVGNDISNPLLTIEGINDLANTTSLIANISPYVNITDKLVYRYRFGVAYNTGTRNQSISALLPINNIFNRGFAASAQNTLSSNLHTHTVSYNDQFTPDFSFGALVGYEYQKYNRRAFEVSARDFDSNELDYFNILANSTLESRVINSIAEPEVELQSYFGRLNFNLKERYLLTATVRVDGSSKFGENNKYGFFPSAGFAWNMHNESFLKDVQGINSMKLRLGFGQVGNQEFAAGAAQERYGFTQQGVALENAANPDLKWEVSTTYNVGLDFQLFNYRLSGTVEYFDKSTTDLLFQFNTIQPAPAGRYWINLDGDVRNSGVEMNIDGFIVDRDDLTVRLGANATFINNELSGYEGPDVLTGPPSGQGAGGFLQRFENGQPLHSFFVRRFTGLDSEGLATFQDNGDFFYFAGDPNPDVLLGITGSVTYKQFSAGFNLNGNFGHQVYNNTKSNIIPIGNLGSRNVDATFFDIPGESTGNAIVNSDRFVENADFLRLNNLTLGYDIGSVGVFKNVNLSLTGQNLFVITNYSGFDPEVNTPREVNGIPSYGIELAPYPPARTFILSLRFGL